MVRVIPVFMEWSCIHTHSTYQFGANYVYTSTNAGFLQKWRQNGSCKYIYIYIYIYVYTHLYIYIYACVCVFWNDRVLWWGWKSWNPDFNLIQIDLVIEKKNLWIYRAVWRVLTPWNLQFQFLPNWNAKLELGWKKGEYRRIVLFDGVWSPEIRIFNLVQIVCLFVCLSVCLSVCMSFSLCVYLFFCLWIYLSVWSALALALALSFAVSHSWKK